MSVTVNSFGWNIANSTAGTWSGGFADCSHKFYWGSHLFKVVVTKATLHGMNYEWLTKWLTTFPIMKNFIYLVVAMWPKNATQGMKPLLSSNFLKTGDLVSLPGQLHQTGQANKGTTRSVIFVCDNVNCLVGQALQSSPCLQEQTLVFFYTWPPFCVSTATFIIFTVRVSTTICLFPSAWMHYQH